MNYFLHGKDNALIKEELKNLLKKFSQEDVKNATVYDGNFPDFSLLPVLEDLNTISMFSDTTKIIVLRNPYFLYGSLKNNQEETFSALSDYVSSPADFSTLIIYWDEKAFSKREDGKSSADKFIRLLRKECEDIEVKQLDVKEFQNRVRKDLKDMRINIEPDAIPYLFELLSTDVEVWKKEAEKLQLYGERIGKEDLPYLITRSVEDKTYELTNAIMQKNLRRTMQIWDDLLLDKNNDAKKLIIMIANNFRKQYEAIILSRTMNNLEIAKEMHIPNPNAVYHLLKNQHDFPLKKIYYLLDKLAVLDQQIKSYTIDPRLGAELFFIEAVR